MNRAVLALIEVAMAAWYATGGAFAFFRTEDVMRFKDRWGLWSVDPASEFWQTNTRMGGAFAMGFSLLLYLMFIVDCVQQYFGQKF